MFLLRGRTRAEVAAWYCNRTNNTPGQVTVRVFGPPYDYGQIAAVYTDRPKRYPFIHCNGQDLTSSLLGAFVEPYRQIHFGVSGASDSDTKVVIPTRTLTSDTEWNGVGLTWRGESSSSDQDPNLDELIR